MSSTPRRVFVTLLQSLTLVILSGSLAFGQSFTASIRGTAKDPTGASVPRASVSITDADRGTSQTTQADEEGRFTITALPPGQYVLTVEAAGFKKFSSARFTLAVQQQATFEARLEVGEVSETVEVTSSAALVNTTIANLGQVIDNKTIVSLPNIGRNPMAFTYLTPGVVGSGGRPGRQQHELRRQRLAQLHLRRPAGRRDGGDRRAELRRHRPEVLAAGGRGAGVQNADELLLRRIRPDRRRRREHGDQVRHQRFRTAPRYYFLRHSDAQRQQLVHEPSRPGEAVLPPRSARRRDRRPGDQEQDLLLRAPTSTRSRRARSAPPATVPTLLQREGDFSKTRQRRRAVDDDLQPLRHLHQRAGEPRTPAVPGKHASRPA